MSASLRPARRLAAATALAAAALGGAAEPPPAAPAPAPAETAGTVRLPVFEVSASRLREIDVTIQRLEKQIIRERRRLERTSLDETLNGAQVARAAALLGGKSTDQRASVVAVRLASLERELNLLETLRAPLTAADRALVESQVEEQRRTRRELDLLLR